MSHSPSFSACAGCRDCRLAGLARSDAHHVHDVRHHDLSVPDLSGARGVAGRFHHVFKLSVADQDLQANLGEEADRVLAPAIRLGLSLLASESLDLGDRHALDADGRQRIPDLVELVGTNDEIEFLHRCSFARWRAEHATRRDKGNARAAAPSKRRTGSKRPS
jgi:hypothetical protein